MARLFFPPQVLYSSHLDAEQRAKMTRRNNSDTPQPVAVQSRSFVKAPPRNGGSSINTGPYVTRSVGGPFGAGVVFERYMDLSPPTEDEIIIVTVRVRSPWRRASVEGCEDLPSRPPPRSFLRRMSTRLATGPDRGFRYTAIKMPRRCYKAHFARDKDGNYAGTEPEREWDDDDLQREFGEYQAMPLRSIPGCSEYGEGDRRSSVGATSPAAENDPEPLVRL